VSDRLQGIVVITVVAVWAALTVGSFLFPAHNVPTTVDTVMGIIAGGAVANEVVRRATRKGESGKNGSNKTPSKPVSIHDEAIKRGRKAR
jgi:hypothetical protein